MADGILLVRLADGAREPFGLPAVVNLFDGAQRRVHSANHTLPNIEFTIPVTGGLNDTYRVVVSAKDHMDAGQLGIPVREGSRSIVDVMLIPRRSRPLFRPLAELNTVHPKLTRLIEDFLTGAFGSASEASYQRLQNENPAGLITLLSIASAFADFTPPDHPLDFIEKLVELKPDRFFAEARDDMQGFLESRPQTFKSALSLLHPDAFVSFKEGRYPEGNVQFTFAHTQDPTKLTLDSDIDLFADTASHLLLEFVPNDILKPSSVTDARRGYAMRWMSVERQRAVEPSKPRFDPPFSLVLT